MITPAAVRLVDNSSSLFAVSAIPNTDPHKLTATSEQVIPRAERMRHEEICSVTAANVVQTHATNTARADAATDYDSADSVEQMSAAAAERFAKPSKNNCETATCISVVAGNVERRGNESAAAAPVANKDIVNDTYLLGCSVADSPCKSSSRPCHRNTCLLNAATPRAAALAGDVSAAAAFADTNAGEARPVSCVSTEAGGPAQQLVDNAAAIAVEHTQAPMVIPKTAAAYTPAAASTAAHTTSETVPTDSQTAVIAAANDRESLAALCQAATAGANREQNATVAEKQSDTAASSEIVARVNVYQGDWSNARAFSSANTLANAARDSLFAAVGCGETATNACESVGVIEEAVKEDEGLGAERSAVGDSRATTQQTLLFKTNLECGRAAVDIEDGTSWCRAERDFLAHGAVATEDEADTDARNSTSDNSGVLSRSSSRSSSTVRLCPCVGSAGASDDGESFEEAEEVLSPPVAAAAAAAFLLRVSATTASSDGAAEKVSEKQQSLQPSVQYEETRPDESIVTDAAFNPSALHTQVSPTSHEVSSHAAVVTEVGAVAVVDEGVGQQVQQLAIQSQQQLHQVLRGEQQPPRQQECPQHQREHLQEEKQPKQHDSDEQHQQLLQNETKHQCMGTYAATADGAHERAHSKRVESTNEQAMPLQPTGFAADSTLAVVTIDSSGWTNDSPLAHFGGKHETQDYCIDSGAKDCEADFDAISATKEHIRTHQTKRHPSLVEEVATKEPAISISTGVVVITQQARSQEPASPAGPEASAATADVAGCEAMPVRDSSRGGCSSPCSESNGSSDCVNSQVLSTPLEGYTTADNKQGLTHKSSSLDKQNFLFASCSLEGSDCYSNVENNVDGQTDISGQCSTQATGVAVELAAPTMEDTSIDFFRSEVTEAAPTTCSRGAFTAASECATSQAYPQKQSASTQVRSGAPSDVDVWIEGFHKTPPVILSELDLWTVCQRTKQILVEENNVQPVPAPCIVCGDIHGQFYDLLKLFEVGGRVGEQNYVFLGDYVDRGYNSVETFQYLMLLKLKHPRHITLLRGNHESRQITTVYGFYDECVRKYGNANAWKYCTEVFDYLALAAVVEDEVFCVHGGLSPELKLLDQLRLIYRVQEIPHEGTFGDIVWSDPDDVDEWAENPRGAGWLFGDKVVKKFNHLNGLQLIARAHQLAMEGFRYMFPSSSVVTVWSAPNYCYRCGNVAALMKLDSQLQRRMLIFRQTEGHHLAHNRFRAVAHYFL